MSAQPASPAKPLPELVLTRVFDAPRALVFRAWTEPEHLARWFGPHGFTIPECEVELRAGGRLRLVMRGPDGADYPMTGEFREVVPPERLVYVSAALNAQGRPELEVLTTVTFSERGGKTALTLRAQVLSMTERGAQYAAGMEAGWTQSLERLVNTLAGRAADAPLP
jgi:uncharacterized protein YndB with AHSA1/START domain